MIPVRGFARWASVGRGVLLLLVSACLVFAADPPAPPAAPADDAVEVILVPAQKPWLLALAAPLAGRLARGGTAPLLLSVDEPAGEAAADLLKRFAPKRCLVLGDADEVGGLRAADDPHTTFMPLDADPAAAAVQIAVRFWQRPKLVVLASLDDPSAVLAGAALAAVQDAPFLPFRPDDARGFLQQSAPARTVLVTTHIEARPDDTVDVISVAVAAQRLVAAVGPRSVRTVVLTRRPDADQAVGGLAWLAPYVALVRKAPLVVCDTADGPDAEAAVLALVRKLDLRPRTVTILADYDSLGAIAVKAVPALGDYEVEIEPCSGPGADGAAAFGVGRLPFATTSDGSLFLARGLARERLLGDAPPRVLMIANPNAEIGPLPLCETISRATAAEFRNLGMHVDEYYTRLPAKHEEIDAAERANLILYEGHITDFYLFETPPPAPLFEPHEDEGHGDFLIAGVEAILPHLRLFLLAAGADDDNNVAVAPPLVNGLMNDGPAPAPAADDNPPVANDPPPVVADGEFRPPLAPEGAPPGDAVAAGEKPRAVKRLDGLPLLVLQSCHSLESAPWASIFAAGGVGLVGSVTNIHSASGSAFIKGFCDAALYRDATVGEALRDARNYFFCLAALKARRGHQQQAKAYRVSLSFRLWGDPELRLPRDVAARPLLPPVTAEFEAPDRLRVVVPEKRLAACATEKYVAEIHPGSELAGVVRSLKGKTQRRLMPFYFFRLPLGEGDGLRPETKLELPGDPSVRALFLADRQGRLLYVLFFPEHDKGGKDVDLLFTE